MPSDSAPAWAFLSALGAGGAAAWVTKWFDRRKTSSDVTATVQNTYSELLDDLRQALNEERARMTSIMDLREEESERRCAAQIAAVKAGCEARISGLESELAALRAEGIADN